MNEQSSLNHCSLTECFSKKSKWCWKEHVSLGEGVRVGGGGSGCEVGVGVGEWNSRSNDKSQFFRRFEQKQILLLNRLRM